MPAVHVQMLCVHKSCSFNASRDTLIYMAMIGVEMTAKSSSHETIAAPVQNVAYQAEPVWVPAGRPGAAPSSNTEQPLCTVDALRLGIGLASSAVGSSHGLDAPVYQDRAAAATAPPDEAGLVTVRPAIKFRVYGVRVEHMETAVHAVCGPIARDPNRPAVCPCRFCQLDDAAHRMWSWC